MIAAGLDRRMRDLLEQSGKSCCHTVDMKLVCDVRVSPWRFRVGAASIAGEFQSLL